MKKEQRLYWSVSMPLRWLGLTLDEWAFLMCGLIPGIFMLNSGSLKQGLMFISVGCGLCYFFKKFKKLSAYFLLKSWLLAKGLIPTPSTGYPNMLGKRVGK